jgi:hypothetical protein
MNFTDQAVRYLAWQMSDDTIASREQLEARFIPLIRVVLRTGCGRLALVRWIQQRLPSLVPVAGFRNPADAERIATRMARLLCAELLQKAQGKLAGAPTRETVVGC